MSGSRRRFRGITLAESMFVMALAGAVFAGLIALAERSARRALLQADARSVTAAADAVLSLAEADLAGAIAAARTAGGGRLISRADLAAGAGLETPIPDRAPSGSVHRYAHFSADANTLVAAAWATGGRLAGGGVLPAAGIRQTGRVGGADGACRANRVCGPGLRMDITAMIAALGADAPVPGSMISVRFASALAVNDRLLRSAAPTSRPELSRMAADLEVTGSMRNAASVDATSASVDDGGSAWVAGELSTDRVLTAAAMEIREGLTSGGGLTVSGAVEGIGSARATGGSFGTITAPEAVLDIAGSATFGGNLTIGLPAARSGGVLTEESGLLEAGNLAVPAVRTPWFETGNLELGTAGTVTGTSAVLGELRSRSATGPDLVNGGFRSRSLIHVDSCPNCGTAP